MAGSSHAAPSSQAHANHLRRGAYTNITIHPLTLADSLIEYVRLYIVALGLFLMLFSRTNRVFLQGKILLTSRLSLITY